MVDRLAVFLRGRSLPRLMKGGSTMSTMTRRAFMRNTAYLAGGAICTVSSGSGLLMPIKSWASKVVFLETTCGENNVQPRRVLVAYASMHGSTGEVAEAIGRVLCGHGAAVDIRLIKNVNSLTPYEAVVVGSAVRRDKWLPEAKPVRQDGYKEVASKSTKRVNCGN